MHTKRDIDDAQQPETRCKNGRSETASRELNANTAVRRCGATVIVRPTVIHSAPTNTTMITAEIGPKTNRKSR